MYIPHACKEMNGNHVTAGSSYLLFLFYFFFYYIRVWFKYIVSMQKISCTLMLISGCLLFNICLDADTDFSDFFVYLHVIRRFNYFNIQI